MGWQRKVRNLITLRRRVDVEEFKDFELLKGRYGRGHGARVSIVVYFDNRDKHIDMPEQIKHSTLSFYLNRFCPSQSGGGSVRAVEENYEGPFGSARHYLDVNVYAEENLYLGMMQRGKLVAAVTFIW